MLEINQYANIQKSAMKIKGSSTPGVIPSLPDYSGTTFSALTENDYFAIGGFAGHDEWILDRQLYINTVDKRMWVRTNDTIQELFVMTGFTYENTYTTGATLTSDVIHFDRTDTADAYSVDLTPSLSGFVKSNIISERFMPVCNYGNELTNTDLWVDFNNHYAIGSVAPVDNYKFYIKDYRTSAPTQEYVTLFLDTYNASGTSTSFYINNEINDDNNAANAIKIFSLTNKDSQYNRGIEVNLQGNGGMRGTFNNLYPTSNDKIIFGNETVIDLNTVTGNTVCGHQMNIYGTGDNDNFVQGMSITIPFGYTNSYCLQLNDSSVGAGKVLMDIDGTGNAQWRDIPTPTGSTSSLWEEGTGGRDSVSQITTSDNDAAADFSMSQGFNTLAYGVGSVVTNLGNVAAGKASTAEGNGNITGYGERGCRFSIDDMWITVPGDVTSIYNPGDLVSFIYTGDLHYEAHNTNIVSLSYNSGTDKTEIIVDVAPYYDTVNGSMINLTYNATIDGDTDNNAQHVEGSLNIASGRASHAEGFGNSAFGIASHAEGNLNVATDTATNSHVGGERNTVSGADSFVHSKSSTLSGGYSAIIGGQNITGTADDTVYVPNLNINYVPGVSTSDEVLTRETDGTITSKTIVLIPTTTFEFINQSASFTIDQFSPSDETYEYTLTATKTDNTAKRVSKFLVNQLGTSINSPEIGPMEIGNTSALDFLFSYNSGTSKFELNCGMASGSWNIRVTKQIF